MTADSQARLLVLGWNFRTAASAVRERVAFTAEEIRTGLQDLVGRGVVSEGVIVSTCHRSEIYGLAGGSEEVGNALTQVKIEDMILVTASGHENLSASLPKRAADIERLMKKP